MKLYAVGVGPGAPDLLTLRAAEILKRVPVIFSPLSAMGTPGRALEVVRGLLDHGRQRIVELSFPMHRQQDELEADWRNAAAEIVTELRTHGEGAFITIGDVSLYSTFAYVQQILGAEHPDLVVEMVPGIPSFSAMTALLGVPYGLGDDRIAILPATSGRERLGAVLREFETVILMKVNRLIDEVLDTLADLGLTDHATFVTKCGMPDQEVVRDVRTLRGQRPSYLSILLVTKTVPPPRRALASSASGPVRRVSMEPDGSSVQAAADTRPPAPPSPPAPGGTLFLVGLGPGKHAHLTARAREAIQEADVVIGYRTYVRLVRELIGGKDVQGTGMTEEIERARRAVELAYAGRKVALISSGDAGVYGMAGPALEVLKEKGWRRGAGVDVEVIPGVTALSACASVLGAPVNHDFAAISLSNLLTPWEVIAKRVEAAAAADYVIALYNPKSGRRTQQIVETRDIVLRYRRPDTPVGIVKSGLRDGEHVVVTTLGDMLGHDVGMLTTILIGNSTTFVYEGLMVTPRGYQHKYELASLDGAAREASEAMIADTTLGTDPFLGRRKGRGKA